MNHESQKNIFNHNFHLFFPICEGKEFVLFQLLTIFDNFLKKLRMRGLDTVVSLQSST